MEEAPENSKESLPSAHANGMNEFFDISFTSFLVVSVYKQTKQELHILLNHKAFVLNLHYTNLELLREIFTNKSTGKQSVWTRNRQVNIMIISVKINHPHNMAK
jgi:hypothetical protein